MKQFSRANDCVTDIQSHSQISACKDAAIAWHQQLSGPSLLARDLPVSTPRRSPDGSEESLNNPTPHKVPAAPVTKFPCRGSGSAKPRCPRLAKTQKLGGMAV